MAYVNNVTLIGNVGSDPEIREFNGTKFSTFKVATTKKFRDRNNEQHEQTQWHTCSAVGNIAEVVEKYIKKGMLVFVSGELNYRTWTDREGNERNGTEVKIYTVQMLEKRPKDAPEVVTQDKIQDDLPF